MPKDLIEIHATALRRFNTIVDALYFERKQCLEDRRFYSIAGAQWEGLEKQFENKPKFEVNKVHLSVIRIINEYRNNRITVDFVPKDGQDDDLSDTCDGRYRADEEDSGAQEAYDNAFEEAVAGGFGAWRLRACYEDEEDDYNDYQRITFEPIFDADQSVFFDLAAKRQDKADARFAFVVIAVPKDAYIEQFGGDNISSWPNTISMTYEDYNSPDIVYIAEYYTTETYGRVVQVWQDLQGNETRYTKEDFENDPDLFELLTATGSKKIKEKRIKSKRIAKYILNGGTVLEDCGPIVGKCIPIVPMYGKRWYVDSVERCMGHVRLAKDAQRLKNMQLSKLGEISAMSSVEKPIMTPEQVIGHEAMWADDNIRNFPYLLVNPVKDMNGNTVMAGPTGYTRSPQIPPAMAALLQITEQDMQDVLGNQQAAEQIQPNISGKAIELIQNKLDMQAFIYMSNMAKAVKRCGEIWLSMAKEIYAAEQNENRKLKLLNNQKETQSAELMQPYFDEKSGELKYKNNFADANFDLSVQVGPSTSSKRAATVRAVTGMMQMVTDPQDQAIMTALALMNIEGEGIADIRKFSRKKLVSMGVIEPNEQERQELEAAQAAAANQQQNAEQQYIQALATESMAKAQKAQADTMLTVAKTEQTKTQTADIINEMDIKTRKNTVETMKELSAIQRENMAPAMP
jgi:Phage P22-like portal protein